MVKQNIPMKVDEDFERVIKNLQKNFMMKKGEKISVREITKKIARDPILTDFERRLLEGEQKVNMKFRIKFDGGKL